MVTIFEDEQGNLMRFAEGTIQTLATSEPMPARHGFTPCSFAEEGSCGLANSSEPFFWNYCSKGDYACKTRVVPGFQQEYAGIPLPHRPFSTVQSTKPTRELLAI